MDVEMPEATSVGSGFPLDSAQDLVVGGNSLQIYTLSSDELSGLMGLALNAQSWYCTAEALGQGREAGD